MGPLALGLVLFLVATGPPPSTATESDPWAPTIGASGPVSGDQVATDIVTGHVLSTRTVETERTVYTIHTVGITDRERGELIGEVEVEVEGGRRSSGTILFTSHEPELVAGVEYRLMLVAASDEQRSAIGAPVYSVVGGTSGVRRVDSGPVTSSADAYGDYRYFDEYQPSFPTFFSMVATPPDDIELELLLGAFVWDFETCSTIEFGYNGPSATDPNNHFDGVNTVGPAYIPPADSGVLARAYWEVIPGTNAIAEWDIGFNTAASLFSINAEVAGTYDWFTVALHEFGHILGLAHSPAPEEVMFYQIGPNELKWLGDGDINGATRRYRAHPFVDITTGSYYERPVAWLNDSGISGGTSPTTYSPNQSVTRAQMATFLHRASGSPAVGGGSPFVDVPTTGTYYSEPVRWAYQQGITTGTSPTMFSPDQVVSRAQMAAFLHRWQGSPATSAAHPFSDVSSSAYYDAAVSWLYENGITSGTSPGMYSPGSAVSRAAMATFLHRIAGEPETC